MKKSKTLLNKAEGSYNPLSSKHAGARIIVIKDSHGRDLAHSSFFTRSEKYDLE